MKYMAVVRSAEGAGMPPPALMEGIANLGIEATKAGVLVETGGLLPSAGGALVRLKDGELIVTDGPFAEAREVIGGYAVYDVSSKDEVLEWTRRFMEGAPQAPLAGLGRRERSPADHGWSTAGRLIGRDRHRGKMEAAR